MGFSLAGKGSEIGDYLTTHPLVNCISFTGGDTGALSLLIGNQAGACTNPKALLVVSNWRRIELEHDVCRHGNLQEGLHGPDPGTRS